MTTTVRVGANVDNAVADSGNGKLAPKGTSI